VDAVDVVDAVDAVDANDDIVVAIGGALRSVIETSRRSLKG
jgi:hypothetical protein